ncbi:MAG: DUF1080 domain-containing protein [Bacteroidales bacterium]|nr:DUF1080 domain-containing protein [Bacteroidales bacterium]
MKRIIFCAAALALITACGNRQQELVIGDPVYTGEQSIIEVNEPSTPNCPPYVVVSNPEVDLSAFPVDEEGYHVLFNGNEKMQGWRGYGKEGIPPRWIVEDGCIKFCGTGLGEGQTAEGGDLIFAHQFQNFILELEWKVAKGGNSGIFYLAKEIAVKAEDGSLRYEPIYLSSPEYQVLDNANHPDAFLGVDGNRQSASLYDMIPAKPQNQKPFDEWNKAKIMVYKGTVVHGQNDANVLEYHLWTPKWTDMLQNSKFSAEAWPIGFELLNNCGGAEHKGYIGIQDHGDDVWYRNIRIKIME